LDAEIRGEEALGTTDAIAAGAGPDVAMLDIEPLAHFCRAALALAGSLSTGRGKEGNSSPRRMGKFLKIT
jgi:hypothetical protein